MAKKGRGRLGDTSVVSISRALGRRVVRLGNSGINVIDLPADESICWKKASVAAKKAGAKGE
jgi:hypothetical protein